MTRVATVSGQAVSPLYDPFHVGGLPADRLAMLANNDVNAFFCPPMDLMAWDRAVMVPVGQKLFGTCRSRP